MKLFAKSFQRNGFFFLWEFQLVKDKKLQKPHSAVFLYQVTDMQWGIF